MKVHTPKESKTRPLPIVNSRASTDICYDISMLLGYYGIMEVSAIRVDFAFLGMNHRTFFASV